MESENDAFHDTCGIITVDIFSNAHHFESPSFINLKPLSFPPTWSTPPTSEKRGVSNSSPKTWTWKEPVIFPRTHPPPMFFQHPKKRPKVGASLAHEPWRVRNVPDTDRCKSPPALWTALFFERRGRWIFQLCVGVVGFCWMDSSS